MLTRPLTSQQRSKNMCDFRIVPEVNHFCVAKQQLFEKFADLHSTTARTSRAAQLVANQYLQVSLSIIVSNICQALSLNCVPSQRRPRQARRVSRGNTAMPKPTQCLIDVVQTWHIIIRVAANLLPAFLGSVEIGMAMTSRCVIPALECLGAVR